MDQLIEQGGALLRDLPVHLSEWTKIASDKAKQVDRGQAVMVASAGLAGVFSTVFLWRVLNRVPKLRIPLEPLEAQDFPPSERPLEVDEKMNLTSKPGFVQCFDKATAERLGEVPDMSPEQVEECILKAKRAQKSWALTSFATRRYFLKLLLRYTVEEKETICRVMMRDTGKSKMDAVSHSMHHRITICRTQ